MGGNWPVILTIAIFVAIFYFVSKWNDSKVEQGVIVRREGRFWRQAYVYTAKGADFSRVLSMAKAVSLHDTKVKDIHVDSQTRAIVFKGRYTAELEQVRSGEAGDVWCFRFTHYVSHNMTTNAPEEQFGMNALLTAIEKGFLAIDPGTQVTERENSMKTRARVF